MPSLRYRAPRPSGREPVFLVAARGTPEERWCAFYDRLEIGRDEGSIDERSGVLLVADATVSRSHCLLTYNAGGRCSVLDRSRNGTRVDGRRLMPNVEVELRSGQTLSVGAREEFVIVFNQVEHTVADSKDGTLVVPERAFVTMLVGDIRDYTLLVRRSPSPEVQRSVRRVFHRLTRAVAAHGGTIKEFQGDALVAFWDGTPAGECANAACRAALHLDALTQQLAADSSVWGVDSFPLHIDWALASGPVSIDNFGTNGPVGLSMVGEAPIVAFRLEKMANEETGRILVCPSTWAMACASFRFRDLGEMIAKGFDRPDHVFALEGPLVPDAQSTPVI